MSSYKYLMSQPKSDKFRFYVYAYIRLNDSENGKAGTPYYIGKGSNGRAWNNHGHIHFTKEQIVILESNLSEIGAFAIERRLIAMWGRLINKSGVLHNISSGGEGVSGISPSAEQIQKCKETIKKNLCESYSDEYTSYVQLPHIREKIQNTNIERYGCVSPFGSIEVQQKSIETNLSKYGVTNISKLEEIKIKKAETFLENHGYTYGNCPEINNRTQTTNIERYGSANVYASDAIKDKIKKECLETYGVEHHSSRPEIRQKISKRLTGIKRSKETIEKLKLSHRGKVTVIDTRTMTKMQVTQEEYDTNDFYIGVTSKLKPYLNTITQQIEYVFHNDERIKSGILKKM